MAKGIEIHPESISDTNARTERINTRPEITMRTAMKRGYLSGTVGVEDIYLCLYLF